MRPPARPSGKLDRNRGLRVSPRGRNDEVQRKLAQTLSHVRARNAARFAHRPANLLAIRRKPRGHVDASRGWFRLDRQQWQPALLNCARPLFFPGSSQVRHDVRPRRSLGDRWRRRDGGGLLSRTCGPRLSRQAPPVLHLRVRTKVHRRRDEQGRQQHGQRGQIRFQESAPHLTDSKLARTHQASVEARKSLRGRPPRTGLARRS